MALAIAVLSLIISLLVAFRLRGAEARLRAAEIALRTRAPSPSAELPVAASPLRGLRVALDVNQDHPHAVFSDLLKEALLREDVLEVLAASASDWDLLIAGELKCNGYAEVFYEADFTCSTPSGPICTIIQRPPHGDRPANLAIEIVDKLKIELDKQAARSERRQAIRELGI